MHSTVKHRSPRGRSSQSGLDYANTREVLIRRALELWTERGFTSTGLSELLNSVNVPKGSFYHYFDSKEAFGAAVISAYSDYLGNKLHRHAANTDLSPLDRLRGFVSEAQAGLEKYEYRRGCLVGNLGQELAGMDASLRHHLSAAFERWESQLTQLLEEGRVAGELSVEANPAELSRFFWLGWEGAILRARLERSGWPLTLFARQFFHICQNAEPALDITGDLDR